MKNNFKKPCLTIILTACLLFTLISVPSKADEPKPTIDSSEDSGIMPLLDYIFNE